MNDSLESKLKKNVKTIKLRLMGGDKLKSFNLIPEYLDTMNASVMCAANFKGGGTSFVVVRMPILLNAEASYNHIVSVLGLGD